MNILLSGFEFCLNWFELVEEILTVGRGLPMIFSPEKLKLTSKTQTHSKNSSTFGVHKTPINKILLLSAK